MHGRRPAQGARRESANGRPRRRTRPSAATRRGEGRRGDAIEAAGDAIAAVKPKLRGVSHEWAFFVSLVLGAALIIAAKTPKATLAVAIYAVSLSALLGTSALYHRVNWKRPNVRRWMRRLDHSMIFFLIAGTYTPFALLVLNGWLSDAILVVVWAGAIAGAIVEMVWIDHPKWVAALIYLSLGWVAVVAFPGSGTRWGWRGPCWSPLGGLLYTAGAVVYATQRPNPSPRIFGYHEVFHALVIVAAAAQFAAVAFFALPLQPEHRGEMDGRACAASATVLAAAPALVAALLLVAPASRRAGRSWGAIAVNPKTGKTGYSFDYDSIGGAKRRARHECGKGCVFAVAVRNGWAALVLQAAAGSSSPASGGPRRSPSAPPATAPTNSRRASGDLGLQRY